MGIVQGQALHVWSEKEHTGFVHGVAYDPLHEFAATMCIDRSATNAMLILCS